MRYSSSPESVSDERTLKLPKLATMREGVERLGVLQTLNIRLEELTKTMLPMYSEAEADLNLVSHQKNVMRITQAGLPDREDFKEVFQYSDSLAIELAEHTVGCLKKMRGQVASTTLREVTHMFKEFFVETYGDAANVPERLAPLLKLLDPAKIFSEPKILREDLGDAHIALKISENGAQAGLRLQAPIEPSTDGPVLMEQIYRLLPEDVRLRSITLQQPDAAGNMQFHSVSVTRDGAEPHMRIGPALNRKAA